MNERKEVIKEELTVVGEDLLKFKQGYIQALNDIQDFKFSEEKV